MEELDLHTTDPEHDIKPMPLVRTAVLVSLIAAVLITLLFGWLAEEVMEGPARGLDLAIRNWMRGHATPARTKAAFVFSFIGDEVLMGAFILSLAVFLFLRWRRAAGWLAVSMGGALVLDLAFKFGFHRPRPQPFFGPMPHTYSFPSGHALFALCFFGVMAGLLADRTRSRPLKALLWSVAATLIAAIGLSRIYLGVHYPSDVLAGYLTAAWWVTGIVVLDHLRIRRKAGNSMQSKTGGSHTSLPPV